MLRSVFSVWAWFDIGVCVILGLVVQVLLVPLTWPFERNRLFTGRCLRLAGRMGAILNPLWRVRIVGKLPARRPRKAVFVSNHCSQSDIFVICYLPWEMKWLCKESLFNMPIFGWCLKLSGDIPIKRGDRDSTQVAMASCRDYVEAGMPVMIFPEGTRSRTGEMGAFKDGAFRLAIETGATIVPLAVTGTETALPKTDWRFGEARATVQVGEFIPTAEYDIDDLEALKTFTRNRIQSMRDAVASG